MAKHTPLKLKTGKGFKMPKALEPYRELICNTGGLSIEELMERTRDPDCNVVINAPLALVCQSVESQMILLVRLHNDGLLARAAIASTEGEG